MVSSSLEKLKQSQPVEITWRSFELRPKGSPPIPAEYLKRIEATRPRLFKMAREQYGLELNPGPLGIHSRAALIGAKYAEAQGASHGARYQDSVFRAYWQRANNIEDIEVLAELAHAIGLNREAFLTALEDRQFEAQVDADIEQAYQYGLNGVPALVFEERYLVSGAQPYEVLRQVVEKIEMERQSNGAS